MDSALVWDDPPEARRLEAGDTDADAAGARPWRMQLTEPPEPPSILRIVGPGEDAHGPLHIQ